MYENTIQIHFSRSRFPASQIWTVRCERAKAKNKDLTKTIWLAKSRIWPEI